MRRFRRIAAMLALAVIVLAVAGFLFLHTPYVRSRAMSFAIREVATRFRLTLTAADLRYNLAAGSVSLSDVTLAARGHEAQPFFAARQVRVHIPLAVYRGRLAFNRIEVDEGRVDVVRAADGTSNLPGGGPGGPPPDQPRRLDVRGLSINTLDFTLDDRQHDVAIAARGVTATLERGGPLDGISGPFAIKSGVTVRWRERNLRLAPIDTVLGFDGSSIGLRDLPLHTREMTLQVGGRVTRVLDAPTLDLTLRGPVDLAQATDPSTGSGSSRASSRDEWVTSPVPVRGRPEIAGTMTGPPSQFTLALDINGRDLAIGRAEHVSLAGPIQLTPDRFSSTALVVTPAGGGSIRVSLDVPFDDAAPSRIKAAFQDLDARGAVALANLDPPAIGAALSGELDFTPGDDLALVFSTRAAAKPGAGLAPVAGSASGGIAGGQWTLTHDLTMPGIAAAGRATGRFARATPSQSGLGGATGVTLTDFAAAASALAPLGVAVPDFVRRLEGIVKAPVTLAGTFADPHITASVEADQLQVPSLGRLDVGADLDITRRMVTVSPLFASRFSTVANGQVTIDLETKALGGAVRVMSSNAADLQTAVPPEWQLEGSVMATGVIGGTTADPIVDVTANGSKIRWGGQAFDALNAQVRITPDDARIDALRLQQGNGRIETRGSYVWETRAYTAVVDGQSLTWRGALVGDTESQVTLSAHFEGAGTVDRPMGEGRAAFTLSGGAAGDLVGDGTLDVTLDGQDARLRALVPSLGALVTGTVGLASPQSYRLVGVLNRVDLAKLVPLAGVTREVVQGQASLSVAANGSVGENGDTHVFANLQTLDATVGDVPVTLREPARIAWENDELTVTGFEAAIGKGTARASGTWASRAGTKFEGAYTGDLGEVLRVARVFDLPADVEGAGVVNAVVRSTGDAATSSATLIIDKGRIAWGDLPPVSDLQVEASYGNEALSVARISGTVTADQVTGSFAGSAKASVRAFDLNGIDGELLLSQASFDVARIAVEQQRPTRITFKNGSIGASDVAWTVAGSPVAVTGTIATGETKAFDLTVKGTTDLRVITAFVPAVAFDGTADLDVHVGGSPGNPDLEGRINLKDAQVALPNPRTLIGDLSGPILLNGSRITIPAMRGSANGGDLTIEGALNLVGNELTGQLHAQASGVAVEFPRGLRSEADLILTFDAGPGTPRLTGDVRIQRGAYTDTVSLAALARTRVVSPPRGPGGPTGPSYVDRIALNISLVTVEDMVVDNNYGRFETGAALRLVGTVAEPGMTGRVTMREGGEVYLAGRTFQINRGEISFAELSRIAPEFDLEAQARVGGADLTMNLRGPIEKPEFQLSSSSNDKSPEELAAMLVGVGNTGESALTLLSADLLGVTGRALGLSTLRIDREATFDTDFREDPTLIATDADPATRLTVARRLRDDIEVTVSQSLRDDGKMTVIVSYYILPQFEIRAISKDEAEFGLGIRHQLTFGGSAAAAARAPVEQPLVTAITLASDPAPLVEAEIRRNLKLTEGERFNFYQWQEDIDRITADYVGQGHYEARVRGRRVETGTPGSITLEYRLQPGPRTVIDVQGIALPASQRQVLQDAWTHAVFDRFLMDDLEAIVRRHLVNAGDIEGTVESRLTLEAGLKRVTLLVEPGARAGRRAITFTGNAAVPAGDLAEAVTAAGLDVDAWLDPQKLVPVLQAYYRDHGFLAPRVSTGVPHIDNGRGVLPVTIDEGLRATVTEVVLSGVHESRTEEMRAALNLTAPLPYDSTRVGDARDRLDRAYRTRGFNTVRVNTDAKADAAGTAIVLTVNVEEGPQQILREVVTSGATRTRDGVVSRALDLPVGEPVNLDEWAKARKRLYDTNVFRQVDVVAEPMGDVVGGVEPVRARVTVAEYPPWRFRYGLQLEGERQVFEDGDLGADELGVVAEVKNQNLFGRAITGGLFGRYERLAQDGTVFASNASFFGLPIRSNAFGFFTRDMFRGHPDDPSKVIAITDRIGASFEQRVRQLGVEFTYAYRYETNHTYDPEPPVSSEFPPLNVRANLARLSSAVILDRRSDLLNARTGTFSAASLEHAAHLLGSDVRYTKLLAQQQFFASPRNRLVFASRAQLGQTWHPEELLPSDRFRAGGATTVRGYPEESLGPTDFFGLPRGGGQLLILNQEVRFPIYRWFGGVSFIDVGNVFDVETPFAWSELKIGYGVGLRLSTPVGVLRLDFGIPGSAVPGLPDLRPNTLSSRQWYFGLGHIF